MSNISIPYQQITHFVIHNFVSGGTSSWKLCCSRHTHQRMAVSGRSLPHHSSQQPAAQSPDLHVWDWQLGSENKLCMSIMKHITRACRRALCTWCPAASSCSCLGHAASAAAAVWRSSVLQARTPQPIPGSHSVQLGLRPAGLLQPLCNMSIPLPSCMDHVHALAFI